MPGLGKSMSFKLAKPLSQHQQMENNIMDILAMQPGNFHNLDNFSKFDLIREAFGDVMDGTKRWDEIQQQTGLSEERCKEIYHLFILIRKG